MQRRWFLLIGILVFGAPPSAWALTIGVDPGSQVVGVGETANAELTISGLGDFAASSLSTFDVDVSFDPTILAFNNATFGDPVLGDQLDLFGLGSVSGVDDATPGVVNLFELSLDLPGDLDTLQAGDFTLATLDFTTLRVGTSPLPISVNALGDAFGDPLSADVVNGGVEVIPEPATLALLGAGILGFGLQRSGLGPSANSPRRW